ncbi:cell growth regulator with RING finger domain protein 1 isoform X2 [Boleophthalmus pectinirostris]|uniref:cell growth regulator with RING finger domain protein 1 isoform X2 n=1 Tax=Boleophthalmus pectinirostris TaxID=150288 RepID=UPI00242D3EC6|nr:cell growth regulator with RING finger domain protein 1 isoform X2 [Boleophthalmus pectinirostris]
MVAVFLVTLYEYSPLFYISVVFLCFVVTAAMVLGWVGFDVHAILRNSDEEQSVLPTPEKQMVRVTNPFTLELACKPASVADGVWLRLRCLESSVLSCFWGCDTSSVQAALKALQHSPQPSSLQCFQEALAFQYNYSQKFHDTNWTELFTHIPAEQEITDFGPLPRQRYPLVAVLTLAEQEAVDNYNIVASVTVIHVPDDKYTLSARTLFQYLFTAQGSMYELKPLFMSADSEEDKAGPSTSSSTDVSPNGPELDSEEEQWSDRSERDCVVCQNAKVNKVLLPCRHTCVCENCVLHLQHCPVCRAFIIESFILRPSETNSI